MLEWKKQNKTKTKYEPEKEWAKRKKKNRERTYSKMCHPRSESWAKKFPLLTHWRSRGRGSGSTKHEAPRESRGESEHVWESDSTRERERASCGELPSRLHRLHKQETHHGEQLSCAQLHLPNWERRHTHTHTYVLTHWHTHAPWHSGRRLAHGLLHSAQQIFFASYVVVLSNVSCGAQRKRIFLNWLFRFLTSFVVYSLYISLYCFPSFQVLLYVI